jgi:cation diffusion facilitator CzcD-associated flavoprotein CzcO
MWKRLNILTRWLLVQEYQGGRMHRYPGIRSDSDLHTFGYRFKPWLGAPFVSAEEMLKYMGDVIHENQLDGHIRYQHIVETADWSSKDQQDSIFRYE